MARETIIARIKKLLALASDNPNPHEAASAALKAQALIAEHDVAQEELHDTEAEEVITCTSGVSHRGGWVSQLALAIANNFRCKLYLEKGSQYVFIGYETDAQAAMLLLDKLAEIGEKLAREEMRTARRIYGTSRGVKADYLLGVRGSGGYVNGIRSELEKQSQALMLVTPTAVIDKYEDITEGMKNHRFRTLHAGNSGAANRGYAAGRDSVRQTRIGAQPALGAA